MKRGKGRGAVAVGAVDGSPGVRTGKQDTKNLPPKTKSAKKSAKPASAPKSAKRTAKPARRVAAPRRIKPETFASLRGHVQTQHEALAPDHPRRQPSLPQLKWMSKELPER